MRDVSKWARAATATTVALAIGAGGMASQAAAVSPSRGVVTPPKPCKPSQPTATSSSLKARSSSDSRRRIKCFPLDIEKRGPATVTLGDTIPYEITVTNNGKRKVEFESIVVTDPGVTDLAPPADPPEYLKPGKSATWTASRAATADACGKDIVNTAWVRISDDDDDDDDDSRKAPMQRSSDDGRPPQMRSDSWATAVVCPTDLAIVKTGPATVAPGVPVVYSIVVTNNGSVALPSSAVQVSDPNATAPTPVGDVPPMLEPGGTLTWTATGTQEVSACAALVKNTATVTVSTDSGWTDTGAGNNASSWTTQIVCPVQVSITKTTGQATVEPGGVVTYSIGVTNTGAFAIPDSGIAVDDPGALLGTPSSSGPLDPGATRTWPVTKQASTDPATCGTQVLNTASVSLAGLPAGWADTGVGERSANAPGVLVDGGICTQPSQALVGPQGPVAFRPASGTLGISKSGPQTALAGGTATYRITVVNNGAADLVGVVVRDQPPSTMALTRTPAGATRARGRVSWDIGSLRSGESVTKTVTVRILRTTRGTACNVATVSATGIASARARACTTVQVGRRPATPVTG